MVLKLTIHASKRVKYNIIATWLNDRFYNAMIIDVGVYVLTYTFVFVR